jgi:uncharacterized protein YdhG (YjbR/CyaY superfamily)
MKTNREKKLKKHNSAVGLKGRPGTVDEYLASVPKEYRTALNKLRKVIKSAAPKAEELIWYRIPTFKLGRMLVSFAAFRDHCSFFPLSAAVLKAHKSELKNYETSKGTIRFPANKPLPASLVKRIVQARIEENEQRARGK